MNYTLLLYKEDGHTSCRGCVMDEWGSEFDFHSDIEESEAIDVIVEAFTRPSVGGEYTAHLIGLIGGTSSPVEKVVYEFDQCGGGRHLSNHCDENDNLAYNESTRISKIISDRTSEIISKREEAERILKQKKLEREKVERELSERRQLEALKRKYENNNQ